MNKNKNELLSNKTPFPVVEDEIANHAEVAGFKTVNRHLHVVADKGRRDTVQFQLYERQAHQFLQFHLTEIIRCIGIAHRNIHVVHDGQIGSDFVSQTDIQTFIIRFAVKVEKCNMLIIHCLILYIIPKGRDSFIGKKVAKGSKNQGSDAVAASDVS
jgi:hypothetical protein